MARARYAVLLSPGALQDFRALSARDRSTVRDVLEQHLRHEPRKVSRSRIKKLQGTDRPQYRLRVGDLRVFYDVAEEAVEILAIVRKDEAASWLAKAGGAL